MNNSVIVSLRDIVVEFDGQRILDGLNLDIHDDRNIAQLFCPVLSILNNLCQNVNHSADVCRNFDFEGAFPTQVLHQFCI